MKTGNRMVVYEEYLIYNTMGMIGSVGGTFGMFIGFSITGFISSAVECLKNFKRARQIYSFGNMETSKSDGNSVEMKKNYDDQTGILNANDFSRDVPHIKQVPKSQSSQTMEVEFVHGNRKNSKKRKQYVKKTRKSTKSTFLVKISV